MFTRRRFLLTVPALPASARALGPWPIRKTKLRRDSGTGKLGGPAQTVPLDSPLMMLFA